MTERFGHDLLLFICSFRVFSDGGICVCLCIMSTVSKVTDSISLESPTVDTLQKVLQEVRHISTEASYK